MGLAAIYGGFSFFSLGIKHLQRASEESTGCSALGNVFSELNRKPLLAVRAVLIEQLGL